MMPPNEISTTPCPVREVPAPRERQIPFSPDMVRAVLSGRKSQTRRLVKHRWPHLWNEPWHATGTVLTELPRQPGAFMEFRHRQQDDPNYQGSPASTLVPCPYGEPGDRLWVREHWRTVAEADPIPPRDVTPAHRVWYEADKPHQPGSGRFRHGMFMPRWASRMLLEVTGVRVERLQDISEADARAEGMKAITKDGRLTKYGIPDVDGLPGTDDTGWPWSEWRISPIDAYRRLWEQINGNDSWAANPWVWVVEFRRLVP